MNKIEFGNNRETMKKWASEGVKVQMCVTSPPYYGLRDYGTGTWIGGDENCNHFRDSKFNEDCSTGHHGMGDSSAAVGDSIYKKVCAKCGAIRQDLQLGLEETPEEYIENMVDVFRHVRDILADDGVIWVNIGDTYVHSQPGRNRNGTGGQIVRGDLYRSKNNEGDSVVGEKLLQEGYKTKDLIGIPWMLAFALRADGWYLRQDIIWHKPNPMPESVTDRCTKAHEYFFLLSKNQHYYFDNEAIKEPVENMGKPRKFRDGDPNVTLRKDEGRLYIPRETRNKRSVWTVNTKPYKGAHFAVYPEELIEPCILSGSRFSDVVFDPFMGSGTTAAVAIKHGRKYLGCELNPDYQELQQKRIDEATKSKPPIIDGDPDSLFTFEKL